MGFFIGLPESNPAYLDAADDYSSLFTMAAGQMPTRKQCCGAPLEGMLLDSCAWVTLSFGGNTLGQTL